MDDRQEFLTIDLAPFLKSVHQKLAELGEARAPVVEDPEILGVTPIIRNTRVPVYDVAASVAAGLPMTRILAAYPGLTAEMVNRAAFYATANPARGRPREHSFPPAGAFVVSTRRARVESDHEAARRRMSQRGTYEAGSEARSCRGFSYRLDRGWRD